jgi:acyl dehydratase
MSAQVELIERYQTLQGQEIHVGPWLEIDQQRIDDFARVTGDEQWIHVDPQRAEKESPYGTTIAHGFLTLSLLPYLTQSNHPEFFTDNYPGMRLCGSKIRARTTVQSVEEVRDGVQIVYLLTIEIEGEKKPACVAEQLMRVYPN